jgi:hypothetical protein
MTEHRLEVADVFRQHGKEFFARWGHTLSDSQRKVLTQRATGAESPRRTVSVTGYLRLSHRRSGCTLRTVQSLLSPDHSVPLVP